MAYKLPMMDLSAVAQPVSRLVAYREWLAAECQAVDLEVENLTGLVLTSDTQAIYLNPSQYHRPRDGHPLPSPVDRAELVLTAIGATRKQAPYVGVEVIGLLDEPSPDADLIAYCVEHQQVKKRIKEGGISEDAEAFKAATERDDELCRLITQTPARTRLGLMWKARVTAYEHELERFLTWTADGPPRSDDERLLISLVWDILQGPAADQWTGEGA
ncbi:hypothetical protein [Methylobacterium soli]|uniref:Uncharacterized protein n=1 Tax=Methylobacterium soli TaxID=553447 RepID=A0A6L3SVW9_9HYPH|nr:hypothetical protein [Methylobacterium soli]KAB1075894.1 hypothetical protein F6X53_23985 [Methylobacterium soli]GJE46226.1 hypothetical protein AEGHOMDF_5426 [Methylobacterium soli]